jgi:hypothetical protein
MISRKERKMKNIKGFAVSTDGTMKRLAVTYDVIDDEGKVTKANVRVNRLITDDNALAAVDELLNYAQSLIEE